MLHHVTPKVLVTRPKSSPNRETPVARPLYCGFFGIADYQHCLEVSATNGNYRAKNKFDKLSGIFPALVFVAF